jgi:MFS family permease
MTSTDIRSRSSRQLSHRAGFWTIAAAFTIAMAFSTIPTPLYAIYQARDGFPTFLVTVIFAAYAVGVAASLYLMGHVSDWLGRRRIILISLVIEVVSGVLFLVWPDVPGLIVARFVSGVGIGALTATATAHLAELRAVDRPDKPGSSAVISSLANIGGLSLGPLISGILAEFVPSPLVVPYVVFLVLLVLATIAVAVVPETVERPDVMPTYRPQRIAVPEEGRSTFFAAGAGAFAGFAIFGLFTSLTPTVLATVMGETSRLVAGVVSFAVFASAALTQLATVRVRGRLQLQLALALMLVGTVSFAASVLIASFWLFVISGIIAGAGVGMLFRSSLGVAGRLAPAHARGEVLAAVFLISYVGLAVPVLLIGLALAWIPLIPVLVVFAVVVIAVVLWATPRMIRTS